MRTIGTKKIINISMYKLLLLYISILLNVKTDEVCMKMKYKIIVKIEEITA